MIDLVEYLVGELKSKRLSKPNAKALFKQISARASDSTAGSPLHPLLHRNTSDLNEQRYSSIFTGREFFLADHRLSTDGAATERVLPAVAYLEMVRAALENAWPAPRPSESILELHNTVWAQPIAVNCPKKVDLVLVPGSKGEVEYEIYSRNEEQGQETETVHCQGRAVWSTEAAQGKLALQQMKGEMAAGIEPSTLYSEFEQLGLHYGPAYQAITSLRKSEDKLLAQLHLPADLHADSEAFWLHPSLIDGAWQACLGLVRPSAESSAQPMLPFALERLRILSACTPEMYALIRYANGSQPGDRILKLDIDLADAHGTVCLQMRGLSARTWKKDGVQAQRGEASENAVTVQAVGSDVQDLREEAEQYLRRELCGLLKVPYEAMDGQAALEEYGIDSMLAMKLTGELEKSFGSLPKTLFFEYQTIAALSGYFVRQHQERLQQLLVKGAGPAAARPVEEREGVREKRPSGRRRFAADQQASNAGEGIAVIGLSGRYPGARDVEAFWDNLRQGKDSITEVPPERWDWREYFSEEPTESLGHLSKWGGFIEGVDEFDPLFFNISPREAVQLDPQERLFLEQAWKAVEDAGYTRASLEQGGEAGVYVGMMYSEYQLYGAEASAQGRRMSLSGSGASIANRVSYVLNLHGPSMMLDTMCSSSLTAIHLACQDLKQGRTRVAIAGGVNVSIHPNKYLLLSGGQFLSSAGHCQSFGEGGDGYIPGEGVGVVVLKRLGDAERDGDHIYGVLRGSALTHGGKTNGYTVPNPQAQGSAIGRALVEAKVDARQISYIEAHGTGTKLGDPIEIAALSKVFGGYTEETGFCLLGSAKSNIGHCESAAGIAGLTKVLLQMQHGEIVPSLHSERLNPHIDFARTPFVVNQRLREWEQPRLAGISSFGAGGSNAHLIVHEAEVKRSEAVQWGEVGVVLSARTAEQLQQKAQELLAFVRERQQRLALGSLAWTLQVGREGMEERLGFVAGSIEEVEAKLEAYVCSGAVEGIYQGQVKRNREMLSLFSGDMDLKQTVEKWMGSRKWGRLLEFWVKGLELDWGQLWGEDRPQRISLPAYPFARERYWIDTAPEPRNHNVQAAVQVLHPLLHSNTSDFAGQRYSSVFTGEEWMIGDHQVAAHGQASRKVLPGVASLEMARAAIEQAWPDSGESSLELRNIVWVKPIVISETKQIHVALSLNDFDELTYEIYSPDTLHPDAEEQKTKHCQGRGVFSRAPIPPQLDLQQLRQGMWRGKLWPAEVYAALAFTGLIYGPAYQAITAIYQGDGEVLAELQLPLTVMETSAAYLLHPSVMDGALHAAIGLVHNPSDVNPVAPQPQLPFALDALRIFSPCIPSMYAWVRYAPGCQRSDAVVKLDIDLCDEKGNVCVQMSGLSSRALSNEMETIARDSESTGSLVAVPVWQTVPLEETPNPQANSVREHRIFPCELLPETAAKLQSVLHGSVCVPLESTPEQNIAERYTRYAQTIFEHIQTILRAKPQGKVLVQIVVGDSQEQALFAGLSGLLRTASLENPQLVGQIVLVPAGMVPEELARHLKEEQASGVNAHVRYEQGARQILSWQEVPSSAEKPSIAFQDDAVYLITGGLGGLGLLFAQEILAQTQGAKVVLAGRSPLTGERQTLLDQSPLAPGRISYRQVDLGNLQQVEHLIQGILADHGHLDGVLHSAGMVADNFILKKTADEFLRVLNPKVTGAYHLDEATKDIPLQFFVLFSSIAGAVGNPGQADYAAANAFMDQFAAYRNGRMAEKQRYGRTLSLNWPLWQGGGMRVSRGTEELLRNATGTVPMQTATGLEAFYRCIALPYTQALVAEGNLPQIRKTLLGSLEPPVEHAPEQTMEEVVTRKPDLIERAQEFLRAQLSSVLKVPAHKIDPQSALERYGIDSILAMQCTNLLETTFGPLSKTLFFEYQTTASLAEYFARNFPAALERQLTGDARQTRTTTAEATNKGEPASREQRKKRYLAAQARESADIAVIGMSGRYPQAKNLQEFWNNLREGRDCITEIPADRWDHSLYYDAHPKPGKSYSKWGGFLADIDKFDPLFFNISPLEASLTDPQERLFLETTWEAIEDAGYSKEEFSGKRVGVFVGIMWSQYELFGVEAVRHGSATLPNSSHASVANRVSYFFNLHGPSIALDTMCSSSLTALHMACEEIRRGEVEAAIAGGVNLNLHPYKYLNLSQGRFLASDGRCRSFGAGGDGYVPGEGVGAVVLKSLANALRDGDQIYGVIKSSSVNHGGKTNGYTVPNPNAQADLILDALQKAKIDSGTLSYIETHGTGTSLGDPIELSGLAKAFSKEGKQTCPIGSVKSNIGHLEAAAGIAAVAKALLQFRHEQLVPSLHASPANPNINFTDTPFYVQTVLSDWPRPADHPRRIGVSSFGAGGSNAHMILEEYPEQEPSQVDLASPPQAFVLSARDDNALRRYAERFVDFLELGCPVSLTDMTYTLQVGRALMPARLAIITASTEDLLAKLRQWLSAEPSLENVFCGNIKEAQESAAGLMEGRAGRNFVEELLTDRDLEKLVRLWVLGASIDWSLLYGHRKPLKRSLPTYPFAKERCWIEEGPSHSASPASLVAPQKLRQDYAVEWSLDELASPGSDIAPDNFLVLDLSDDLFLELKRNLAAKNRDNTVILVKAGERFDIPAPCVYTVNPKQEQDFYALLEDLDRKSALPGVILHHCFRQCDLQQGGQVTRELNLGVYQLFHLCKALMHGRHHQQIKVLSIYNSELRAAAPLAAAMSGFFRSLALENPNYLGRIVDIPRAPTAATFPVIWRELSQGDWRAPEVRYRASSAELNFTWQRYTRRLVRASTGAAASRPLPLRKHGVYLVTGGLGGLGLIFGEYLARKFEVKLVIAGRSAPDARQQEQLNRLEALGAEVMFVQGDVSRQDDAIRIVETAKARFHALHVIIHAAGVVRDAFLRDKTKEELDQVLAAKIYGTLHLDQATAHDALDLFVLFSSVAGVMGNPGQSDYAYANSFLDAFAEYRENLTGANERSGRTLSIDWPLWEEGGMQLSGANIALLEEQTGMSPLPTRDGIAYWEDALCSLQTQGLPLYGDPEAIAGHLTRKTQETSSHLPGRRTLDPAALLSKTEAYLKEIVGLHIKLAPDRIDSLDSFESLGIDSIISSQLNSCLEQDLGALPKTLFYEYESITELARFLLAHANTAVINRLLAEQPHIPAPAAPAALPATPRVPSNGRERVTEASEPIAIVGMHGYYPQSANLKEFWRNLTLGKDLVGVVPSERWDHEQFYDADPVAAANGKIYCRWGGFLDGHNRFDASFFNISPEEARNIDPQERLFMQSVWEAVEDAGYTRDRLKADFPKGKSADVGVFVGVTTNSYHLLSSADGTRPSSLPWSIANRVSYFFDFAGPSLPVDTACSSSLVALHLACESIRRGECRAAIAGGVNLYLHPSKYQSLCRRRMLSQGRHCHSYGAGDDGFIPGEGVGALVLKSLKEAIRDKDHIYAVVRGSGFDHGGRSNGYSAPNPNAQARLLSRVLETSGVDPQTITYVEGHGTGTQMGDGIEVAALTQAFREQTASRQFCALGSVKANIGHAESAAGMASLAKVILQMNHGFLVPSLHSTEANPNIDFEQSPFYLQHELAAWPTSPSQPRRALVNSFGAGGVNACVILEEWEGSSLSFNRHDSPYLFLLSAKTPSQLHTYAERFLDHLQTEQAVDLAGLCYTLQTGREGMEARLAIVASSPHELIDRLREWRDGGFPAETWTGTANTRLNSRRSARRIQAAEGQTLAELANLWAGGEDVHWESLYPERPQVLAALPAYPFAEEQHWFCQSPAPQQKTSGDAALHPLITRNTSTLSQICFTSELHQEEFYSSDHKINGKPIFPGAAFLEMACIAGNIAGERRVKAIKDIVWMHPLSFLGGSPSVSTTLRQDGEDVEFVSSTFDADNRVVTHVEGKLAFQSTWLAPSEEAQYARLSIPSLKEQCLRREDAAALYEKLEQSGLGYGDAFRIIQEIFLGADFALSRLRLPNSLQPDFDRFILHPGLLDGALQSSAGLIASRNSSQPQVPFALDLLTLHKPLTPTCYAYVELADRIEKGFHPIQRVNIRLLNEEGDTLVSLKNLFLRPVAESPASSSTVVDDNLALAAGD